MNSSYNRTNPFLSRIRERFLLTKPTSTKKTYHLSLCLANSSMTYRCGDNLAVLPSNDPAEVTGLLAQLKCSGDELIQDPRSLTILSFSDYLTHKANLHKTTAAFQKTLQDLQIGILSPPQEIARFFLPLLPRFYSIASSSLLYPKEIHLTIAFRGLGPHFLCERAILGETPIPIYLQPTHGFSLPIDSNRSIILVGPGTGIAPFRAFLQERLATNAKGRNWLFFGERHHATDFYYEDFWSELEKQDRLRLDLAFSRDGREKYYVQHRMWEQRKDLWAWIEEGAYFYVCGDAKNMAKDVEAILQQIAATEGGLSEEQARLKIKTLRAEKRYLMDVY